MNISGPHSGNHQGKDLPNSNGQISYSYDNYTDNMIENLARVNNYTVIIVCRKIGGGGNYYLKGQNIPPAAAEASLVNTKPGVRTGYHRRLVYVLY